MLSLERHDDTFTATTSGEGLMSSSPAVVLIPNPGTGPTWRRSTDAFLRRDLAPGTRRVYGLTLEVWGPTWGVRNWLP